jgi:hypothetical protein
LSEWGFVGWDASVLLVGLFLAGLFFSVNVALRVADAARPSVEEDEE